MLRGWGKQAPSQLCFQKEAWWTGTLGGETEAQKKHSPVEEPSLDHLCLRGDPSSVLVKTLLLEGFLTLSWGLVLPNTVSRSQISAEEEGSPDV